MARGIHAARRFALIPRWHRHGGLLGLVVGLFTSLVVSAVATPAGATQAGATQATGTSAVAELRVMTFNIHHGAGSDDVLDLDHVANVIEHSDAQVVALQEVDRHWGERSDFVDQAAWLGERLNMDAAFGANLDEEPEPPATERRQYGTAILSAFPIESWTNTPLPKFEGGEQCGLLEAQIAVDGTPTRVLNTHLQHDNAEERQAQSEAIVDHLGKARRPAVLMGDLNATPDTSAITTLTQRMTDTWTEVGEGDGFTIPVDQPTRRTDYILSTTSVRPLSAEVITTDASDHRPVAVDVLVGP